MKNRSPATPLSTNKNLLRWVEKGESVMVMEAMKMENELRTSMSGTVLSVMVTEGQAVETGSSLMEIKPIEIG